VSPWAAAILRGGTLNGNRSAPINPGSSRRSTPTTESAVAACEDFSQRPGGVDECWESFAAAHGDTDPSGPSRQNSNKNRSTLVIKTINHSPDCQIRVDLVWYNGYWGVHQSKPQIIGCAHLLLTSVHPQTVPFGPGRRSRSRQSSTKPGYACGCRVAAALA
jgi:hypothetical protein